MGQYQPLFSLFLSFQQLTVNMFIILLADDWIPTGDLCIGNDYSINWATAPKKEISLSHQKARNNSVVLFASSILRPRIRIQAPAPSMLYSIDNVEFGTLFVFGIRKERK